MSREARKLLFIYYIEFLKSPIFQHMLGGTLLLTTIRIN
jgi:hypothetical protein